VTGITGQTYLHMHSFPGNGLELGDLPQGLYLVRDETERGIHLLKAIKE